VAAPTGCYGQAHTIVGRSHLRSYSEGIALIAGRLRE
jgi:hypothetical protein